VPVHPLDGRGKTPLNLSQGFYAVTTRGVTGQITPQSDARWKVENKPGREVIQNQLATASAPARVSRTMVASTGGGARATSGAGSTIVFDSTEGRFVNSGNAVAGGGPRSIAAESGSANAGNAQESRSTREAQRGMKVYPAPNRNGNDARVPPATDRMNAREGQGRQSTPATRTAPPPPSVPRAVTSERAFNQSGGGQSGAGRSGAGPGASGGSGGASRGSASSGGTGGGGRSSGGGSSSSGGGGRPH